MCKAEAPSRVAVQKITLRQVLDHPARIDSSADPTIGAKRMVSMLSINKISMMRWLACPTSATSVNISKTKSRTKGKL